MLLAKVGTGFSDEVLSALTKFFSEKEAVMDRKPVNVVAGGYSPEVWFDPCTVCQHVSLRGGCDGSVYAWGGVSWWGITYSCSDFFFLGLSHIGRQPLGLLPLGLSHLGRQPLGLLPPSVRESLSRWVARFRLLSLPVARPGF